jgi:hypothetical protein
MDNETLLLLARFTFQARKIVGAIDSNLLANDANYRNNIFQQIDAQADEGLLVLSMQLRNKLDPAQPTTQAPKPEPEKPSPPEAGKYKFGARG